MADEFSHTMQVRYQDTDARLRLTPFSLVGAMQEAAILQSEEVGRGMAWLSERSQVWMIVQTLLRIDRLPVWKSRVTISTWPSDIGRLLSRREFVIADDRGECARATTLWAFVDTAARRVTRVPGELAQAYTIVAERAIQGPFPRPPRCQNPICEDRRPIRRGDIDSNGHVNNLRYLEWMLDCLPGDLPASAGLRELNIRYQKETLPGGLVRARTEELPESGDASEELRRFAHDVVLADTDERIALAETAWRTNDD